VLGFASTSDSGIIRVLWIGAAAFAATLLLMLQILLSRAMLLRRQHRAECFLAVWRPLLMQSLDAVPDSLPPVARADVYTFLSVWNYLHESLRDESKDQLNQVARLIGIAARAQEMLHHRSLRQRLMAIVTLGHLQQETAWDELQMIVRHRNTMLSLAAARALLQINAEAALPILLPLMDVRPDWPVTRVANLLKEAGADVISQPLARAAETAPRLIRYLEVAHRDVVVPTVRRLLAASQDEQVLQACLPLINDPADVEIVRACLLHPQWLVRVEAVAALGRVGTAEDETGLVELLSDPQWWVRYRAAHSLATLPESNVPHLQRLAAAQTNPFAHDILTEVIAERELAEGLPV
jgi:HEAT repeats